MSRRIILFAFLVFGLGTSEAQDLVFSQFYNAPLHINSAFTGIVSYPSFSSSYRLQWPGITRTYETYALTYDQHIKSKNLGVGVLLLTDSQGDGTIRTTRAKGLISYNLRINRDWQLKFGVGVSYVQNTLDFDKLIFLDQIDPQFGAVDRFGNPNATSEFRPADLSNGFLDIDMGMLLYTPKYYVGLSLFHVNGPSNAFLSDASDPSAFALPVLFSLHAGYQIVIDKDNKGNPSTFISPNVLYANQNGFQQFNVGAYLQKEDVFGGISLRHTVENIDAIIVSAGFHFNNLKISYSYDITVSSLSIGNSGGSHELGITLSLKHLEKKESKLNDCFSLFR